MDDMEEKLGAILNNPQLMQNIMSMAQSLSLESGESNNQKPDTALQLPDIDLATLQKIGGIASQSGIDPQQKALLNALSPFLTQPRLNKLEKAMKAAKMAKIATVFLNSGGLPLLSGR